MKIKPQKALKKCTVSHYQKQSVHSFVMNKTKETTF